MQILGIISLNGKLFLISNIFITKNHYSMYLHDYFIPVWVGSETSIKGGSLRPSFSSNCRFVSFSFLYNPLSAPFLNTLSSPFPHFP